MLPEGEKLFILVETEMARATTRADKWQLSLDYLNNYLRLLGKKPDENFLDISTRVLFITLPEEVVSITLPNDQYISREIDIPDEQKLRWTIEDLVKYKIKLQDRVGNKNSG